MKKMLLAAILMTGLTSFAQVKTDNTKKGETVQKERLTPEQRNSLRVKDLTLKLDLNAQQQQEFTKMFAEDAAKRAEMAKQFKDKKSGEKKLTADEKFAMKNKMMDERIARKAKIKTILNAEQFARWESMQKDRMPKGDKARKFKQHKQKKQ
jgi:protein CpxP